MIKIVVLLTMFMVLVGSIMIYSGRYIVKVKFKNIKNQNKAVTYIKILGVTIVIISLLIIYVMVR